MRRDQLEHAIRAACEVSGDTELLVFGSQAILGSHPFAPESLRTSIEVDIQPKNLPENTDLVDSALGELSLFHQTHGFYVHGVLIEAAVLPDGWDRRTIAVRDVLRTKGYTGYCVEAHDLAASKLVAGREKDRVFAATLLHEGLVDGQILIERVAELPVDPQRRESISRWVEVTIADSG